MAGKGILASKGGRMVLNFAYGIGAAIVIAGALFKIMSWPYANLMLIVGMTVEAVIFVISAFEAPASDYAWERVYPELTDGSAPTQSSGKKAGAQNMAVAKLDKALSASIDDASIERLGENLSKFSENVNSIGKSVSAASVTNEYTDNIKGASEALAKMKEAYSAAAGSVTGLNALVSDLDDAKQDTAAMKQEIAKLSKNLASLNGVYGNMLTAMKG